MKHTSFNSGSLSSLLLRYETALKRNKPPSTLFDVPLNWKALVEKRCPVCNSLLKFPKGKYISICYGKRHGDKQKFIINNSTLHRILTKPHAVVQ